MKPPRQITINPVLNGYVVQVGCQTLAFTSRINLIQALDSYLTNPEQVEKDIIAGAMHTNSDLISLSRSQLEEAYNGICDHAAPPYPTATARRAL